MSVQSANSENVYKSDLWGHQVCSSSDECITFLNKYYIQVLSYGREKRVILQAADADRGCALACGLAAAYLWIPQRSRPLAAGTLEYLTAAKANLEKASSYERLVVEALVAWMERSYENALAKHFEILEQYPKDLLTLKRGQTLCFTVGWSEPMLALALKALPTNVGSAYMFGMLAFALVEVGKIREAEIAARLALSIEVQDVWAQHALCHALEAQCRFKDALRLMTGLSSSWGACCSFMCDHNWWHVANGQLELGGGRALEKVLSLYDEHIWGTQQDSKSPQKCINALGLLLRLETRLHRSTIDGRISQVVSTLKAPMFRHQELLLHVLSVWAFARADELEEASEMISNVKCRALAVEGLKQEQRQFITSLAEAVYSYGRENFIAAADALGPSFSVSNLKALGASNEQLEVFEDVWYIVFLRAGRALEVVEAAERRAREREGSWFSWRILEEAYVKSGRSVDAVLARAKAMALEIAPEKELDEENNFSSPANERISFPRTEEWKLDKKKTNVFLDDLMLTKSDDDQSF
ncbi:hypothetical protein R1sor_010883 [Riccia sorocarpa]|uniref:Tetratricopeptide repeat protein 38 n=1 Tax=Riccia sorocarpa TaxID=122646 RepID=A0ABD3I300_9MARC